MILTFADCTIDTDRFELRRGGRLQPVEPQVFDLLVLLITHRDRVVTKDELFAAVWDGRFVSDATLSSRINAARQAVGDDGKRQAVIRTLPRRGFRFVGTVEAGDCGRPPAARGSERAQEIRFCTTPDGVRLAYATLGGGPPLVKAANWINHLDYDERSPVWRHWLDVLSQEHRLVRYDGRGNGLSDRDVGPLSLDAFVLDLETVVDAAGLDRFALLGISQGCAISIAYALRHPDRVERLVLYGGYMQGWRRRGSPEAIAQGEAAATLIRHGWGQDNPAYRQMFTSLFLPEGTPEQVAWFNELERIAATPETAAELFRTFGDIDVSGMLSRVDVPTLVLHTRDDARAPFDQGRAIAAGIRDARFVPLPGRNHMLLAGTAGWARFVDEFRQFMAPTGS